MTGDLVLIPRGDAHVLADSPSPAGATPFDDAVDNPAGTTDFLCGKYRVDTARAHPLLSGLPEVVHLPTADGQNPTLRTTIDLLGAEVAAQRPGHGSAVRALLDLLLVHALRAWLDADPASGWHRALTDPPTAAALSALHADPGAPWRLPDLAARVGLSRATLARRFAASTGRSPMAYLAWWRLATAAHLLRDSDLPMRAIARQVGYTSSYAFSTAFKRQYGQAPTHYRADALSG
ncbi:AraC family transcriptional regulator [Actinokineospora bangkokensis]|uniref:HTH araC/xylS-type domain-containing protein n=1 Tax=Actinokineospora bangkokensis TaxID=1193682 RepID=A0A1Q9LJZ2_9PSEU|nr:AraC family transcriptional regulator [Actinokineospora bangkokensis]OLR92366.1 hypothetical protein BJP25_19950 [Actinokineospora bangkokensis]